MKLLSKNFIYSLPKQFIINIHPSLLPSFRGLNAIRRTLECRVQYTGITIHYVDEGMDTGSIIIQSRVKINGNETFEILKKRLQKLEHQIYQNIIKSILKKN